MYLFDISRIFEHSNYGVVGGAEKVQEAVLRKKD